jgi:DNA-binding beta-propeller fold protein YncE
VSRRAAIALAAALALGLAGCGSEEGNPPPAEPAVSPPLATQPAGRVLPEGTEAEGVAVDSRDGIAVVSFRDPDRLELIDLGTASVVGRVATPDPARHLEMAGDGRTVLIPIEYKDVLVEFDVAAYARAADAVDSSEALIPIGSGSSGIPVGDFPHDAVQAEDGRIFVGDEGGDTVSVINGDGVTDTLDAPEQPGGVATSGKLVAAVAVAAREIAFWDTDTLDEVAVLDAGAGPSHVVAGDDGRFYVTDTGGDALLVYEGTPADGGPPRLLDRVNLPDSPYGIAIDDERDELWVTRTAANEVDRLDLSGTPKVTGTYPTVRQPNTVGVDERTGRVVVVGRDDGDVQVFDPAAEDG